MQHTHLTVLLIRYHSINKQIIEVSRGAVDLNYDSSSFIFVPNKTIGSDMRPLFPILHLKMQSPLVVPGAKIFFLSYVTLL